MNDIYTGYIYIGLDCNASVLAWETATVSAMTYAPKVILGISALGLMAPITAFFAWAEAVQLIAPSRAALIYYMIPVRSGFVVVFLPKEPFIVIHILSFLLMVWGIYLANHNPIRYTKIIKD